MAKETPFTNRQQNMANPSLIDCSLTTPALKTPPISPALYRFHLMKSNISVGPPIDLGHVRDQQLKKNPKLLSSFNQLSAFNSKSVKLWGKCLHDAFDTMPEINWRNQLN
jgi:predicted proteasome-type protease